MRPNLSIMLIIKGPAKITSQFEIVLLLSDYCSSGGDRRRKRHVYLTCNFKGYSVILSVTLCIGNPVLKP